jgi:hypothetical protein
VGRLPAVATDITNELAVVNVIDTTSPNQASVVAEAASVAAATYATLTYVNTQDATFAEPAYMVAQDLLNLPAAYVGTPSATSLGSTAFYGAASLNSSAQVPIAQMPVLGAGYLEGPWGATSTVSGSTSNVPLRIADWDLGEANTSFRPIVFCQMFVSGVMSHPIVEIKIANSTTAPAYSAMTLCGQGLGRGLYNDYGTLVTVPAPDTTSESYPTLFAPTYNVWITAWLWDLNSLGVTVASGDIVSTAAFLLRGAL